MTGRASLIAELPAPRALAGMALFVGCYVLLDWISLIAPDDALGLTPWNPAIGLAFAMLLRLGARFVPLCFAAILLADLLLRGLLERPLAFGAAAALASLIYGLAALLVRRWLGGVPQLDANRHVTTLLGAALVTPLLAGLAILPTYAAFGLLKWSDIADLAVRFWVGDVIGIAVMTPFLLLGLAADSHLAWRPSGRELLEIAAQAVAIGFGLWLIFGIESEDHLEFSYTLFVPLVWIALRRGLAGAVCGIVGTQFGMALAMHLHAHQPAVLVQFQLLMLAIAVTGLYLGLAVDQRRRAVGELRQSEDRLATVVRAAPDAIATLGPGAAVVSLNPAAQAMFAISAPAAADLGRLLPELDLAQLAEGAGVETMLRRADGTTLPVEVSLGRSLRGTPLTVLVIRDISARRAETARLMERDRELARAMRLATTGEFAASMAHEINQPLTAMIAFVRAAQAAIARGMPGAQSAALADRAVQQALRAGEIVRSTRALIDHGEVQGVRIDLQRLVGEVRALVRAEAERGGVEIEQRAAQDLPAVLADPVQIQQVTLNLLRNALQALAEAAPGARHILVTLARSDANQRQVDVVIEDSGPGFAADIGERLFEPFASTRVEGMGWGLRICRSIIEAHGGQILADRSPQLGGARLRFGLPVWEDRVDEA